MYIRRISEIRRNRIDPQALESTDQPPIKLKDVSAADNFTNLLETPVLFYAICIILFVSNEVTQTQLLLAWLYVVLRALHSFIHVTYNKIIHRWAVYSISTICLFIMWGNFAFAIFSRPAAWRDECSVATNKRHDLLLQVCGNDLLTCPRPR